MALLQFDATNREGVQEMTPVPAGEYSAHITEADMVPSFKDNVLNPVTGMQEEKFLGNQLALTFELLEGPYKGRKIFERLSLQHDHVNHDDKKRQMVEIAQRSLTSICQSINRLKINETNDLLAQPMNIKVKVEPQTTDPKTGKVYEPKNRIVNYFPYKQVTSAPATAQPGMAATAPPVGAAPTAPAAPVAPPWQQQPAQA